MLPTERSTRPYRVTEDADWAMAADEAASTARAMRLLFMGISTLR
jgi:hypothetical protein